jgi:hypothetical protein
MTEKSFKEYIYWFCKKCHVLVHFRDNQPTEDDLYDLECKCGARYDNSEIAVSYHYRYEYVSKPLKPIGRKRHSKYLEQPDLDDMYKYARPETEMHGGAKTRRQGEMPEKGRDRDKRRGRKRGRVYEVEEGAGLAYIPAGTYPATLAEIEDVETEFGDSLRWIFDVEADEETVQLSGITSQKFSLKSKSYEWASALLGEAPDVGDEVDLEELYELPCMVEVKDAHLRDGTDISNIVGVMPEKKAKRTKQPKTGGAARGRREETGEGEEEEESPKRRPKQKARGKNVDAELEEEFET